MNFKDIPSYFKFKLFRYYFKKDRCGCSSPVEKTLVFEEGLLKVCQNCSAVIDAEFVSEEDEIYATMYGNPFYQSK